MITVFKNSTSSYKTDWTSLNHSLALLCHLYGRVNCLTNVELEGELSWLCLLEIPLFTFIIVELFVYFVYIYSCSVCCRIFIYLFTISVMLVFVAVFLFTCLPFLLCWCLLPYFYLLVYHFCYAGVCCWISVYHFCYAGVCCWVFVYHLCYAGVCCWIFVYHLCYAGVCYCIFIYLFTILMLSNVKGKHLYLDFSIS